MGFSMILASSKNGTIGINNKLPWHLPRDLKYFKEKTLGKTVIMGRKTYESIGHPLPGRKNVILTRNKKFIADESCLVFHDIDFLMRYLNSEEENMIIGGEEIYKLFFPYVYRIYHTYIDANVTGNASFIIPKEFKVISKERHDDGEINEETVSYEFRVLELDNSYFVD